MRKLQDFGRRLLLALVRALLPAGAAGGPIDVAGIRRVLVVRTDTRVGNVLLTTPLVRALRKGLPHARIDLLVAAGKQSLVEGLADRIVVFDKQALFRNPLRFLGFLAGLSEADYDVAIDAGHWHAFSFTSAALALVTGARVRIGHARGASRYFLTHAVEKDAGITREVASKLELLNPLGVRGAGEQLDTTVDASPDVSRWFASQLGDAGPYVALNPGARKPDHRWPAEAFGQLARKIADAGLVALVAWGPGERPLAEAVVAASEGRARLAPPSDLAQLARIFRGARAVVTNDTGPMHLAVATGAPVVAVLMADDGARWSHASRFAGVTVREGNEEEVARVFAALTALGPVDRAA